MSLDELEAAAKRYMGMDDAVAVVVGDAASVESKIESLSFGELKRLGVDGEPLP